MAEPTASGIGAISADFISNLIYSKNENLHINSNEFLRNASKTQAICTDLAVATIQYAFCLQNVCRNVIASGQAHDALLKYSCIFENLAMRFQQIGDSYASLCKTYISRAEATDNCRVYRGTGTLDYSKTKEDAMVKAVSNNFDSSILMHYIALKNALCSSKSTPAEATSFIRQSESQLSSAITKAQDEEKKTVKIIHSVFENERAFDVYMGKRFNQLYSDFKRLLIILDDLKNRLPMFWAYFSPNAIAIISRQKEPPFPIDITVHIDAAVTAISEINISPWNIDFPHFMKNSISLYLLRYFGKNIGPLREAISQAVRFPEIRSVFQPYLTVLRKIMANIKRLEREINFIFNGRIIGIIDIPSIIVPPVVIPERDWRDYIIIIRTILEQWTTVWPNPVIQPPIVIIPPRPIDIIKPIFSEEIIKQITDGVTDAEKDQIIGSIADAIDQITNPWGKIVVDDGPPKTPINAGSILKDALNQITNPEPEIIVDSGPPTPIIPKDYIKNAFEQIKDLYRDHVGAAAADVAKKITEETANPTIGETISATASAVSISAFAAATAAKLNCLSTAATAGADALAISALTDHLETAFQSAYDAVTATENPSDAQVVALANAFNGLKRTCSKQFELLSSDALMHQQTDESAYYQYMSGQLQGLTFETAADAQVLSMEEFLAQK